MRKGVFIACVLTALSMVFPAGPSAGEQAAAPTVEDMAGKVIAFFPRAEGRVTSAEGEKVVLNIGLEAGLKPGMEVFLFRAGKPIIHPVTKAVLGSTEEALGSMVLTVVNESSSEGIIEDLKVTRIIPGDTARLSTELVPLRVEKAGPEYDAVLFDRLLRKLRASDRFDMSVPEPSVGANAAGDKEAAVTGESGTGYVLQFVSSPAPEKNKTVVGLKLTDPGGETLLDVSDAVDSTPEVYDETLMDYPLVRGDYRDYYITEDLPFRGKHMAVGNVIGDSGKEVVISDGHGLVIYSFRDRILSELWREDAPVSNKQLSVECADINGNGLDEIYVTNFDGDDLGSYVIEYRDGGFKKICGPVGLFFRILDVPGRGEMLITTTKGSDSPYSGIIYSYTWKDGKLERGDRLELPDGIKDPYGFVLVDLVPEADKDQEDEKEEKGPFDGLEAVWVNDADYLEVLDMDGKKLWESDERYGGYDNYFEVDEHSLALQATDPRGKVKGRLVVREDASGRKTVVLTRNVPLTYLTERFKGYSESDIFSLSWDGKEMVPNWSIRNIAGYIADICVSDVVQEGRDEILVLLEPTIKILKKSKTLPIGGVGSIANITADKSSLLVYKIPVR